MITAELRSFKSFFRCEKTQGGLPTPPLMLCFPRPARALLILSDWHHATLSGCFWSLQAHEGPPDPSSDLRPQPALSPDTRAHVGLVSSLEHRLQKEASLKFLSNPVPVRVFFLSALKDANLLLHTSVSPSDAHGNYISKAGDKREEAVCRGAPKPPPPPPPCKTFQR